MAAPKTVLKFCLECAGESGKIIANFIKFAMIFNESL